MECKAFAKLNMYLGITGTLPDGYHAISSVMQGISLYDVVSISKSDRLSVAADMPYVPSNAKNIAYKAAKVFFDELGEAPAIHINIKKKIPVGAGMAGGSADAAAVLRLLNVMYENPFTPQKLNRIGLSVGADVPFCLKRGTLLAEGKGEKLSVLPGLPKCRFLIIKPPFAVSSARAYELYDACGGECPPVSEMLEALAARDLRAVSAAMGNALEAPVGREYPMILEIKEKLLAAGAMNAMMTGSGSAVFGVFPDYEQAKKASEGFFGRGLRVIIASPISKDINILL